jgi:hypothetical protein
MTKLQAIENHYFFFFGLPPSLPFFALALALAVLVRPR